MSLPAVHVLAETLVLAAQSPAIRLGVRVAATAKAATLRMLFLFMFRFSFYVSVFVRNAQPLVVECVEVLYQECIMSRASKELFRRAVNDDLNPVARGILPIL